jgi:hypothetical protein
VALDLVMFCRVMFGKIVRPVRGSTFPVDNELSLLANAVPDPVKRMSIALERLCLTLELAIPVAVEFSVTMGVGGCLCPNSSRVILSEDGLFAVVEQST